MFDSALLNLRPPFEEATLLKSQFVLFGFRFHVYRSIKILVIQVFTN